MHRTGRDRDRPDTLIPFFTVVQMLAAFAGIVVAVWAWDQSAGWPPEWRWVLPFFALLAGFLADRPVARGRTPLDVGRARLHYARVILTGRRKVDWHG